MQGVKNLSQSSKDKHLLNTTQYLAKIHEDRPNNICSYLKKLNHQKV